MEFGLFDDDYQDNNFAQNVDRNIDTMFDDSTELIQENERSGSLFLLLLYS